MGWSYNPGSPFSDKDKVRLLVGDINSCDQLLSDEEIECFLELDGNIFRAACTAAMTIAGIFSRLCDESVGAVKISFSQKAKSFLELCKRLEVKANSTAAGLGGFAGGISVSDKESREEDDDRVVPKFEKNIHETLQLEPETLRRQ